MHLSAVPAQVFVFLLRLCNPDARKALVRESLDVLTPILAKRLQAGVMHAPNMLSNARGTVERRDCVHVMRPAIGLSASWGSSGAS